jgi:hypothetical protein
VSIREVYHPDVPASGVIQVVRLDAFWAFDFPANAMLGGWNVLHPVPEMTEFPMDFLNVAEAGMPLSVSRQAHHSKYGQSNNFHFACLQDS